MQPQRTCPECQALIGPKAALCKRCSDAAYYRANAERIKARTRMYEVENRGIVRERQRRWRASKRVEQNAKALARYYRNPAAQVARSRKWKRANAERLRKQARTLYAADPARYIRYARDHQKRNPDQKRERDHRWRVHRLAAHVERVDPIAIYERDRWICQICHKPVARGEQSLDHIVPVSRGGTHQPSNVRLAHRRCNTRRGNRGPAQLRMLG